MKRKPMMADCDGNVCESLRKLLSSVRTVRDQVRDAESNESDGAFNLLNFWDTLIQAVRAVSQEATKLSIAFSKPPPPSPQEGQMLSESVLKSVLTLSTVFYWLPTSQGASLRRRVRDATVNVLDGLTQLVDVILSSPLQSLTQDQLTSTGSVWSACDQFAQLPQDNKVAVMEILSEQINVVKDAIQELDQALSQDPFSDFLDNDDDLEGDDPLGQQETNWSDEDRRVIGPCQGLMKAGVACLRKMTSAVRTNGDITTPQNLSQLDDLADVIREISPGVDGLAVCLYPPMDYSGIDNNASKLALLLKKLLETIRSSHVCGESELTWVQFLDGAVTHNLQKTRDLIQEEK
ncbi:cyclin-D1-binding protein 1 homolog [Echeneis naucrates]|uniref:Cyclin D-type binding-protein 1 n=1 Tax=Echeneis naucrates TaxID=173247 RepID=A0A665T786_ECHNA|nr:cyclin-D1-binding protein 1 [Echeneis naucrates]